MYLHLGSGSRRFPGWINIDAYHHPELDATWDLRMPLPLDDGCCRFIFAEHLLEHFSAADGARLCEEFYRLLEPGGVCRLIVPDAAQYWQAYKARDLEWFAAAAAAGDTPLASVNGIYYGHFHRWMYDFETLHRALTQAGFASVRRCGPLQSPHPELRLERTDTIRRDSSLYVEAGKT